MRRVQQSRVVSGPAIHTCPMNWSRRRLWVYCPSLPLQFERGRLATPLLAPDSPHGFQPRSIWGENEGQFTVWIFSRILRLAKIQMSSKDIQPRNTAECSRRLFLYNLLSNEQIVLVSFVMKSKRDVRSGGRRISFATPNYTYILCTLLSGYLTRHYAVFIRY